MILALVLLVLGALVVLGAVTTSGGSAELLGVDDLSSPTILLVGLCSGLTIVLDLDLDLDLAKAGTRRSLQHRREQKRLHELSDQLDRAQAERRHDNDRDEDRPSLWS